MKGNVRNMKKDTSSTCMGGYCGRCHSGKMLVAGLIVLANAYWSLVDWWILIGVLLVIGGLIKMVMPSCGHCK